MDYKLYSTHCKLDVIDLNNVLLGHTKFIVGHRWHAMLDLDRMLSLNLISYLIISYIMT